MKPINEYLIGKNTKIGGIDGSYYVIRPVKTLYDWMIKQPEFNNGYTNCHKNYSAWILNKSEIEKIQEYWKRYISCPFYAIFQVDDYMSFNEIKRDLDKTTPSNLRYMKEIEYNELIKQL